MTRIGIITALPQVELPAAKLAFGIRDDKPAQTTASGIRYWKTRINHHQKGKIEVIIASLAQTGNTESGLLTEKFLTEFHPELLVLVGIGCGVNSFKLGDVSTAEVVWAYEYLKTTDAAALDRSRAETVAKSVRDDVAFFNKIDSWRKYLQTILKEVKQGVLLPRISPQAPSLHSNVWIASGEKVIANGELTTLNKKHDSIRVGEMEGYGFACSCNGHRPATPPWLIVRGISDYGDKSKDGGTDEAAPLKDEYHFFAALAATTFVKFFLENSYTPIEQVENSVIKNGILDVFSSAYDPRFSDNLIRAIQSCQTEATFFGMGLSFLKSNREIISAIGKRLKTNKRMRVRIFYCDPANKGLDNRVEEEANYAKKAMRPYNKSWPKEHMESLQSALRSELSSKEAARIAIHLTTELPMTTIIKIDQLYFWYPYGTPNVRGKESPWLVIRGDLENSPLKQFLDKNLAHISSSSGSSLIPNNY